MNVRPLALLVALVLLSLPSAPAHPQTNADAVERLEISASGGFAGWAVPLPDYAASIVLRGEGAGASSRLVYNDISLTPLRISIRGNASERPCTVTLRNRATTLRLPADAAFLLEPGARPPVGDLGSSPAAAVQRHEFTIPKGGGEVWLPLLLYPSPADSDKSAVEVEVSVGSAAPSKLAVPFNYLPRGRVYGLIVEEQPRGLLPPHELPQIQLNRGESTNKSGYNQSCQFISVATEELGPDFRVLKHFAFIAASAEVWRGLDSREKGLLVDAAGMGGRLIIFGAREAISVGNLNVMPQGGFVPQLFGFGNIAATTLSLDAVMPQLAALLTEKLEWARNLAMGYTGAETGPAAQRDTQIRNELGEPNSYAWLISLTDIIPGQRSLNPFWAYEYLTRAGMMHPMDSPEFHWQGVSVSDASRELVDASTFARRDWIPIHSTIDNVLRRASASNLTRAAMSFTVLVMAVAAVCFLRRCSMRVFAGSLLVVSAAGILLFTIKPNALLPDAMKLLVLSSTIGSQSSSLAEVRTIAYAYSPYAAEISIKASAQAAALSRISPIACDTVGTSYSEEGAFTLERLRLEPLLPAEAYYSSVTNGKPPVTCQVGRASGGEIELKVICGEEPVEFLCLINGARLLYLGKASPRQVRTVMLPESVIPSANDPELAMAVTQEALSELRVNSFLLGLTRPPNALQRVAIDSLAIAVRAEGARALIADGQGITMIGLRRREAVLTINGQETVAPAGDLFVYRVQ